MGCGLPITFRSKWPSVPSVVYKLYANPEEDCSVLLGDALQQIKVIDCATHVYSSMNLPSSWKSKLEIDRYGFFEADIDTDISKLFKSCFLLHYQKYDVFYALPFFSKP